MIDKRPSTLKTETFTTIEAQQARYDDLFKREDVVTVCDTYSRLNCDGTKTYYLDYYVAEH